MQLPKEVEEKFDKQFEYKYLGKTLVTDEAHRKDIKDFVAQELALQCEKILEAVKNVKFLDHKQWCQKATQCTLCREEQGEQNAKRRFIETIKNLE